MITISPAMAATPFLTDPLIERNLRIIAYVAGFLSTFMGILGFLVAFSRNKTFLILAITMTSFFIVTLVSLAVHSFTYLAYHVSILPMQRLNQVMNSTWVALEGELIQRSVSKLYESLFDVYA